MKLGIEVAERTVSRLMPKRRTPPSQTWRTFLTNHVRDLVAIDFFRVPTAQLRVLFVLVVLAHHRRRVLHFNVTEHPTATWTAQQVVDTFPEDSVPAYLLRDRDQIYGHAFRQRVTGMRIGEVLTVPSSPWQNAFAERLIGSIRRECLDHVLVLSERHLRRILTRYFSYYHQARTHSRSTRTPPTAGQSSRQDWQNHPDPRSRWPASSLRPPGGVVLHTGQSSPPPAHDTRSSHPSGPSAVVPRELVPPGQAGRRGQPLPRTSLQRLEPVRPDGCSPGEPDAVLAKDRRETEPLEPIDEAIGRMVSELPGRNMSERRGSLENAKFRRPSVSCPREGSRERRSLADAATPLRRGGSDGTVTRTRGAATGEALLVPPRNRRSRVGRVTGAPGKSADDERVADGPEVARRRGNARGAKGPCCSAMPPATWKAGASDNGVR